MVNQQNKQPKVSFQSRTKTRNGFILGDEKIPPSVCRLWKFLLLFTFSGTVITHSYVIAHSGVFLTVIA